MIAFQKEQRFIVTGASSGIGKGISLILNELGATVIGIGRNQPRLATLKAQAKHPENMFLENKELTEDIEGLPLYVKSLKEKYGKFQGLVYAAGIVVIEPLQILDYAKLTDVFAVNYFAPMFLAKGFADRRNNNGKGAAMVFISSIESKLSNKGMVAYSGSKAALEASAKCISREVVTSGIRVNTLHPGSVDTEMTKQVIALKGVTNGHVPLGIGEPSDIAYLTAFLLSDKAKWITSQSYVIDGGLL